MVSVQDVLVGWNEMVAKLPWWDMVARLTSFNDAAETWNPMDAQASLEEYLAGVRKLEGKAYGDWKTRELLPMRDFVTKYFFPEAVGGRPDTFYESLFLERRFSLLKLAVLLTHYEASNFRKFKDHETMHPELMDCPQALAEFAMRHPLGGDTRALPGGTSQSLRCGWPVRDFPLPRRGPLLILSDRTDERRK